MDNVKKTILIICAVDVTLLLLVFILLKWNIPVLNFHTAIDVSQVAAFGDYFAGIATASTAIIIYLQVNEMRQQRTLMNQQIQEMTEQRKASVRPELFPMDVILYEYNEDNKQRIVPIYANTKIKPAIPPFPRHIFKTISFSLVNIGLGSAKNIVVNWKYDEGAIKEFLKEKIELTENINANSDRIESEKKYKHNWFSRNETIHNFLMTTHENNSCKINIPYFLLVYYYHYLNLKLDVTEKKKYAFKSTPYIVINYRNMFDNLLCKEFELNVELYYDDNDEYDGETVIAMREYLQGGRHLKFVFNPIYI